MRDGSTPKLVETGRVLVDTVKRPTQNLGTLTEGAISRMAGDAFVFRQERLMAGKGRKRPKPRY